MRDIDIPISAKLYDNVDETALTREAAALENAYVTDVGTISRFPELVLRKDLGITAPVYLWEWEGDLMAVAGGNTYRIDENMNAENLTGAAVSGPGRVIFAETDAELLMAAGGPIIRFAGTTTTILSKDAPESTHVAFVDGYVLAIEPRSGRFQYTSPGNYSSWDPLDTLSAEGKPDNLTAMIVSEYGELLLAGPESVEQFDPTPNGEQPFVRRWNVGQGVSSEYTLMSVDNRVWMLNNRREWVSVNSQIGNVESQSIHRKLKRLNNIKGAWAHPVSVDNGNFIILQFPYATNVYGTMGVTLLYDYVKNRWSSLYGWDSTLSLPTRWEGWSLHEAFGKQFVGGNGKIYELVGHAANGPRRMMWRSGHIHNKASSMRIDGLRIKMKRGAAAANASEPILSLRVNKDNRGFGRPIRMGLGKMGKKDMVVETPALGTADTWQFQIEITDAAEVEINGITAAVQDLPR